MNDYDVIANIYHWNNHADYGRYLCLKHVVNDETQYGYLLIADNPNIVEDGPVLSYGNFYKGEYGAYLHFDTIDELLKANWRVD